MAESVCGPPEPVKLKRLSADDPLPPLIKRRYNHQGEADGHGQPQRN
jgi:hypothetical protein